jgi:hypothetical protein
VGACYLNPYAEALFRRNADLIDGLLIDATWEIIPNCVASILMLSTSNVGIPVALAIGPKDDRALDETFDAVLHDRFAIELGDWRVVSDQGTALRSVCTQHGSDQFPCLRHVLVSEKRKVWSDEIGNLIRCRVGDDFARLCAEYEPRLSRALDAGSGSPGVKRLGKLLARVGLGLRWGRIAILDMGKWRALLMMERVTARLPSTSNALESFHGHGKEQTPPRNEFVPAMVRVPEMMIRKTVSFETALADGFGRAVRLSRRRASYGDLAIQEGESGPYGTTLEDCRCAETCHLAAMYRTACPCSHQYRMQAEKPRCRDMRLDLGEPASSLTIQLSQVSRVSAVRASSEQIAKGREHAVKQITRFSSSTTTAEIVAYVESRFRMGSRFVLGRPVSLFGLISDCIGELSGK